jgi:hypothetical protein
MAMANTADGAALLADLADDPTNRSARTSLADWLEDRGEYAEAGKERRLAGLLGGKSLARGYAFFKEWAGYVVGRRGQGALRLARAEALGKELGLVFEWEFDPEPWDGDGPAPDEVLCCGCRDVDEDGWPLEVLSSLCGIADPDRNYCRVVEAELAWEALALLARRRADGTDKVLRV